MLRNRHDTWKRFWQLQAAPLKGTGLPAVVSESEHRLRDLLATGTVTVGAVTVTLGGRTTEQWQHLEVFAEAFFQTFESFAPLDLFPAFGREADRRGTGFMPSGHRRPAKEN